MDAKTIRLLARAADLDIENPSDEKTLNWICTEPEPTAYQLKWVRILIEREGRRYVYEEPKVKKPENA